MRWGTVICVMLLVATFGTGVANVPQTMNYQGVLLLADGSPAPDGDYDVLFSVYDTDVGGTSLWTEAQTVTVEDGIFNAILGSATPLGLLFNQPYWLGVAITPDPELLPRVELTTVPYAFRALYADVGSDGDWTVSGDDVYRLIGNIGIGTDAPSQKLDVEGTIKAAGLLIPTGATDGYVLTSDIDGVATWQPVAGTGDITAVVADDGLEGGAESGDAHLSVGAGDGIAVSADSVAVAVADFAGPGLADDGTNDLAIVTGTGLEVVADTLGLTAPYADGAAYDGVFVNEGQTDGVTADMVVPDVVSSIDGVANDAGNIDLVEGANITITPDDEGNSITIAATGGGDVTAVSADDGLTGGGTEGDLGLAVGPGDGIEVAPDSIAVRVADFAGAGLTDDGANDLAIVTGAGLEVVADTLGLTAPYADGSAYDDAFVNEGQADAVSTDMIVPDVLTGINGVTNDGGQIQFIEGSNIQILANDETNTITIAAAANLQGDITAVIAEDGLYGGADFADAHLWVGAGDGISTSSDSVHVDVVDFAGAGLTEDGSNNLAIVTGTGLEVVADTLGLTAPYADGSAYDAAFVNEGQADAVTADMVVPDVISSLDGVTNDAGDIDLIEGENITITPDDVGNAITIAATGGGDITAVSADDGLTGGGTDGDVGLAVGPGDGIEVAADSIAVRVADFAGDGLADDGTNDLAIVTGTGLEVVADTLGLTAPYADGSAYDAAFVNEGQADAVTADMVVPDVISSLDGVTNDAGDIDLIEGENITITPDDEGNTITISVAAGGDGDWTVSGDDLYPSVPGNVGIGTATPAQKLDVDGTARVTGFELTTGAADGHILASDGLGVGTWQAPGDVLLPFEGTADVSLGAVFKVTNNTTTPGFAYGVQGEHTDSGTVGYLGGEDIGVFGYGAGGDGVQGFGAIGVKGTGSTAGVYGVGTGALAAAVYGLNLAGYAGYFEGSVRMSGFELPNGATDGYVLTSDGGGLGTWQELPTALGGGGTIDRIAKFTGDDTLGNTGIIESGGTVSIGLATKLEVPPAPEKRGYIPQPLSRGRVFYVYGINGEITYSELYETNAAADGRAAIYGKRDREFDTPNDGSGFAVDQTNNAITGYNHWGDLYTFGVAGYCDNDETLTGGVIGAKHDGSYWGSLGYRDTGWRGWGVYTPFNSYVGGNLGVGTETPQAEFDVVGTARVTGFELPTGASDGYVLTSDASGVASWQEPGDADITGVSADDGLTGGGTDGDVGLAVGAGDGIAVAADDVSVVAADIAGAGLADDGANDLEIVTGAGLVVVADTLQLTTPYQDGSAYDGVFVNEGQADGVTADMVVPDVVSSLDGVTNDAGNIDLVEGAGITITPDDTGNTITIAASATGDITAVTAGDGLIGGGTDGDVDLAVNTGDGIGILGDLVRVDVADFAGYGLVHDGANDMHVNAGGGLDVGIDTLRLADAYFDGSAYDGVFVNEGQTDGVTADMVVPNVVSSLDGVTNDAGDIDLVEGANITITPDDAGNTITIAAAGGGDITAVTAGSGLAGGGTDGDVTLDVLTGAGLVVVADTLQLTVPYQDGSAYDARFVNEGQADAVTVAMITPDVISSLDGVSNDGGGIDLVEGSNITITPDDTGNTITIAASDPADGDWTVSGSNVYSAVSGNVGIGTSSPARKLHVSDVLRLEPVADFPSSPSDGDICVKGASGSRHIYCYLNGSWAQLDPSSRRTEETQ